MAAQGALHVLQAVDTAFDDDRGDGTAFIPSTSWKSYKSGYVFKTGDSGLGYYREEEAADKKIAGQADQDGAGPSQLDAAELLKVCRAVFFCPAWLSTALACSVAIETLHHILLPYHAGPKPADHATAF